MQQDREVPGSIPTMPTLLQVCVAQGVMAWEVRLGRAKRRVLGTENSWQGEIWLTS